METAMQASPEISIGIRTVFFLPILQINLQIITCATMHLQYVVLMMQSILGQRVRESQQQ